MTVPGDPMLDRLRRVRAQIDAAAVAAGRDPSGVRLLLATKTQSAERISTALRAGFTLIGENRVQEVVGKAADLASIPHEMHFIGHLQANKINQLLGHISCLETLDSADLARQARSPAGRPGPEPGRADPGQRVRRAVQERGPARGARSTCWPPLQRCPS